MNDNSNDSVTMNPYQREILLGLNRTNKHVYSGTVTSKTKQARRAANKVARASRKTNRQT